MNFHASSRSPSAPLRAARIPTNRPDRRPWPVRLLAAGAAVAVTAGLFAITLALFDEACDDVAADFALGDLPFLPAGFLPPRAEDCRGGGDTAAPGFVVSVPRTAKRGA